MDYVCPCVMLYRALLLWLPLFPSVFLSLALSRVSLSLSISRSLAREQRPKRSTSLMALGKELLLWR